MTDDEIYTTFDPLWDDINKGETFPAKTPLLAHYTSIPTLESIMGNNEIWFSNPLYMNDLEELSFGILESAKAFRKNEGIRDACGDPDRYKVLSDAFEYYLEQFANKHALDTYVFCLSEHDPANSDGLLSMWRGYGGNGKGAALIFDTSQIQPQEGSPLIISKVVYASASDRLDWINKKLNEFSSILAKHTIPTDQLYLPAHKLFERLKMFALFTKHLGFYEEQEWRVVYLRERDKNDMLAEMLHYSVGHNGIQPKLKLKVQAIIGVTSSDLSLEKFVTQIILGPTVSSPLALSSVQRMLEKVGKKEIAQKVSASTIPFRT